MATLEELEAAVDSLLDHPLGVGHYQLVRQAAEKAYEAYVFGLCLRAVRELAAVPVLHGVTGPPVPFVFRGAPGQIHSTSRNYGFAAFSLNGKDFEIHAGVEFKGTSGVTHEFDVCIMAAEEARSCRQRPEDPRPASLVAGWECKFHAGSLQKVLGRAFVGLMDDMGTKSRIAGLCSNSESAQLKRYLRPQRRPHPHFGLSPQAPSNENIFVNILKGELKKLTAS